MINGRGEVQGRLAQGEPVALDRTGLPPLTLECFPARSPDLGRRFAIAIAGPGDEVLLPSLTLYGDGPEGP